jgi:N-methylhydantoinase A
MAVLGIDTGGTFTDFVLVDTERRKMSTTKVPSTPHDPAIAIAAGLDRLDGIERIERVVIGTTVATNAVLERRGPKMIYITNVGFEDVPFIGRIDKERVYDLHWVKPKPLVERRNCFGVTGRYDIHGNELAPLTEESLENLRAQIAEVGDENLSVAICCLFSYLNGDHESRTADVVRSALPTAHVSMSHEISPIWREYERASTTLADAFVKPVVNRYVERVGSVLSKRLTARRWNVLASNGGYLRADQVRERPSQLLLSGLAGGVIGGRLYAELQDTQRAFTLDIGGTSTDIGLILDGGQQYASEFKIDFGVPVTIPCVAVETIGAGGGSIGWVDKGGLLRVGPQSAGADPGPAAYARGGADPAVTDANLALGRLNPDYFLGGAMPLDLSAAVAAVSRLGERLDMGIEQTALAMVRMTDENMANAIRLIAVERGLDTRDFSLIAFGGAGPVHARAVAEKLGMKTVLIPPHPGLCSAFGAAVADARVDRVKTFFTRSEDVDMEALSTTLRGLCQDAVEELRRSIAIEEPIILASADMRYAGQNYELEVPIPGAALGDLGWAQLVTRFGKAHADQYGFAMDNEPVELINLRVTALRAEPMEAFTATEGTGAKIEAVRDVWFDSSGPVPCNIYRRSSLSQTDVIFGPAIIEELDSTTVVFPGDTVRAGVGGILLLEIAK